MLWRRKACFSSVYRNNIIYIYLLMDLLIQFRGHIMPRRCGCGNTPVGQNVGSTWANIFWGLTKNSCQVYNIGTMLVG